MRMNLKLQPPLSGSEPQCDMPATMQETSYDAQMARRFEAPTHFSRYSHDIADCIEEMMVNHAKNQVVKADRDDTR